MTEIVYKREICPGYTVVIEPYKDRFEIMVWEFEADISNECKTLEEAKEFVNNLTEEDVIDAVDWMLNWEDYCYYGQYED